MAKESPTRIPNSKPGPTPVAPRAQVITEASPAASGDKEADPDGAPAPNPDDRADHPTGAAPGIAADAVAPGSDTPADPGPDQAEPDAEAAIPADEQAGPPLSVNISVDTASPEIKANITGRMKAEMKASLADQSPEIRAALRQALDEIDAETRGPSTAGDAAMVDVVEILEPFQVKFNGQKFALQKGARVANPEFAHFLQEGTFPVKPVRQKGADA